MFTEFVRVASAIVLLWMVATSGQTNLDRAHTGHGVAPSVARQTAIATTAETPTAGVFYLWKMLGVVGLGGA
jgi:hypothetical protein